MSQAPDKSAEPEPVLGHYTDDELGRMIRAAMMQQHFNYSVTYAPWYAYRLYAMHALRSLGRTVALSMMVLGVAVIGLMVWLVADINVTSAVDASYRGGLLAGLGASLAVGLMVPALQAAANALATRRQEKLVEWVMEHDPDLVAAVRAGIDPSEAPTSPEPAQSPATTPTDE